MRLVDPAADHFLPDRAVVMPVLAAVADTHPTAIRKPDTARALDLQKKHVNRIVYPGQFQSAPVQYPVLFDLGAGKP